MPATTAASVLRSLTTIRRLGNGLALEAQVLIEDLYAEIVAELAKIDPTGPAAERWRRERAEKLADVVRHLTAEGFKEIHKAVREDLATIGEAEARMVARRLADTIGPRNLQAVGVDIRPGRIGRNMVKQIIDADPIDGLRLGEWFQGQAAGTAQRVMRQVRLGMLQSEPIRTRDGSPDLVTRIRGRSVGRGRYVGGVMDATTREAETIARTAVQYIANRAHLATYAENADVLSGLRFVATLESRTCEVCRAYDGKVWALESSEIQTPPLHPNCRCVLAPVVAWDRLGITPPAQSTRASGRVPGTGKPGQVPAGWDYETWLREQPVAFQREVLGPGRYKLFADGKVSLRDMIRTDHTVMTIHELERRAA